MSSPASFSKSKLRCVSLIEPTGKYSIGSILAAQHFCRDTVGIPKFIAIGELNPDIAVGQMSQINRSGAAGSGHPNIATKCLG